MPPAGRRASKGLYRPGGRESSLGALLRYRGGTGANGEGNGVFERGVGGEPGSEGSDEGVSGARRVYDIDLGSGEVFRGLAVGEDGAVPSDRDDDRSRPQIQKLARGSESPVHAFDLVP